MMPQVGVRYSVTVNFNSVTRSEPLGPKENSPSCSGRTMTVGWAAIVVDSRPLRSVEIDSTRASIS